MAARRGATLRLDFTLEVINALVECYRYQFPAIAANSSNRNCYGICVHFVVCRWHFNYSSVVCKSRQGNCGRVCGDGHEHIFPPTHRTVLSRTSRHWLLACHRIAPHRVKLGLPLETKGP